MGKIELNDVIKRLHDMEEILDEVSQIPEVWPGDRKASVELRQALVLYAIYLAFAGKGITDKLLNDINLVLQYNLDVNDIKLIISDVVSDFDGCYTECMLSDMDAVILYACDAEDALRNMKMNAIISLPQQIRDIYGIVGKLFMGDMPSKLEMRAYTFYMMKINSFLAREGYLS